MLRNYIVKNLLTIEGELLEINNFITNFTQKGFDAYFPTPEILKEYNTETPTHHMIIESLLKQESYVIYNSSEIKSQVLNMIEQLIKNKQYNKIIEKEIKEIYKCLKTGYFSWLDFNITNWGVKLNATNIEQLTDNIISFNTIWNAPETFFKKITQILPLTFKLSAYNESNILIKTFIFSPQKN